MITLDLSKIAKITDSGYHIGFTYYDYEEEKRYPSTFDYDGLTFEFTATEDIDSMGRPVKSSLRVRVSREIVNRREVEKFLETQLMCVPGLYKWRPLPPEFDFRGSTHAPNK